MVSYSALADYDRSVMLTLDDRPDPQLWGHCRSTHNSWPKSEVKKTFTYLLNGLSVHCLCQSYLGLNGFTFFY